MAILFCGTRLSGENYLKANHNNSWQREAFFKAKIGLFPREKAADQSFQLRVTFHYNSDATATSKNAPVSQGQALDRLWRDAAILGADCQWLFRRGHCRLLETAAAGIYAFLWSAVAGFGVRIEKLEITLAKIEALGGKGIPSIRFSELLPAPPGYCFYSPDLLLRGPEKITVADRPRYQGEGLNLYLHDSGIRFSNSEKASL